MKNSGAVDDVVVVVCSFFWLMNGGNNQAMAKYAPFVFNSKFQSDLKKRSCKKSCIDCLHFNAATTFQWANKMLYVCIVFFSSFSSFSVFFFSNLEYTFLLLFDEIFCTINISFDATIYPRAEQSSTDSEPIRAVLSTYTRKSSWWARTLGNGSTNCMPIYACEYVFAGLCMCANRFGNLKQAPK